MFAHSAEEIDYAEISFGMQTAAGTFEFVVWSISIGTVFAAEFVSSELKHVYSFVHICWNLGEPKYPLDSLISKIVGPFDEFREVF